MALSLSGISASSEIGIGLAHLLRRSRPDPQPYSISHANLEAEVSRYQLAIAQARRQLHAILKQIPKDTPTDITDFIDTHLLMLEDGPLAQVPVEIIRAEHCNAEWALKLQCDALCRVFDEMDDPYLRTRRDDVIHVVNRIHSLLDNEPPETSLAAEHPMQGYIVIADDLSPADLLALHDQGIAGFITEYGGPLSHTAILARNLRVPALMGVQDAQLLIREMEPLIIDGENQTLLADTSEDILDYYRKREEERRKKYQNLTQLKKVATKTACGVPIKLRANIEFLEDAKSATAVGSDGVGLYRTEFLFMNRADTPSEEEHFNTYRDVMSALVGKQLTIRTLDLGADKQLDSARSIPNNPALGLRAIRLCLMEPELFLPQLRAILRVSAFGPVQIMLPMISSMGEIHQALQLIEQCKQALREQGHDFNEAIKIGAMIEVPAAALIASQIAQHMDFLSIGTNDLIQYTLAIDRIDTEVNHLYDPIHPGVLSLIHTTIRAAQNQGVPVSLCGEMGSDPRYTRLLIGMGLTDISLHPASLLDIKQRIAHTQLDRIQPMVEAMLNGGHELSHAQLLEKINAI